MVLTDRGQRLSNGVSATFQTLRKTVSDLADTAERRLSVCVLVTFAASWLIPRLPTFEAASPGIGVQLTVAQSPIDPYGTEFDVAITIGKGKRRAGLCSHRLLSSRLSPVCCPGFLKQERTASRGTCCTRTCSGRSIHGGAPGSPVPVSPASKGSI